MRALLPLLEHKLDDSAVVSSLAESDRTVDLATHATESILAATDDE